MKISWRMVGFTAVVWFLFVVGIVIAALVSTSVMSQGPHRDKGLYGVFLSNGQVYFGTIAKENSDRLLLTGIYYLQAMGGAPTDPSHSNASDVTLQKLGSEVHGPEDWMEINTKQILFIEKLKDDGRVAKAIQSYTSK